MGRKGRKNLPDIRNCEEVADSGAAARVTPWWSAPLVLLILLAAALAVYGDLLAKGPALTGFSDITAAHLSTKQVLYRSVQSGHGIPFWRDDELSGAPALTSPQSLYTYPLYFLFCLMPLERALGPTLWLHFLVAGVAFYLLGTALCLCHSARLVMGLAGMFNYKLIAIAYSGWLPAIPSVVVLPLLIAAVLYALREPGLPAALCVALSGVICVHAGHMQFFYYAVLFLTLYAVVHSLLDWRAGNGRRLAQGWIGLSSGAVLAIGTTAYLLVPMAAEAPLISRSQATFDFFLSGHALKLPQLADLFSVSGIEQKPEFWEDTAYFGVVPLLLALMGAVLGRKRATTWYLASGFLLSLVLTMDTPLLHAAFSLLPGFSLFRCPARFLFLTSIFGIGLAGVGVQEMFVLLCGKWRQPALALGAVAALAVLMALDAHASAFRLLGVRPWFEKGESPAGIAALPQTQYAQFLAQDRGIYRVAPVMRSTVNYGWAAPMNLQLITGFDSYNFRHYQTYMDLLRTGKPLGGGARVWTDLNGIARLDLLDSLNVSYIITPRRFQEMPPGLQAVAEFHDEPVFVFYRGLAKSDIFVYRNTSALPRAWWAARVTGATSETEMVAAVETNNLHTTAVVLGPASTDIREAPGDSVQIVAQRDGYLAADLITLNERFLVLSEVWHPGWQARLDGKPAPLIRANIALMGLWVSPGKHRLVLQFQPLYWWPALSVSILAGSVLAALVFYVLVLRRKHSNAPLTQPTSRRGAVSA